MVTRKEHTRLQKIITILENEKAISELNIRDRLGISVSLYQQIKRDARLRYPYKIKIESNRGEEDQWSLYETVLEKEIE